MVGSVAVDASRQIIATAQLMPGSVDATGQLMQCASIALLVFFFDEADDEADALGFFDAVEDATEDLTAKLSDPSTSVTVATSARCTAAPGTYAASVFACACMPAGYSIAVDCW